MLNFVVVNARIKCDNLKAKHDSVVGEQEKTLNKALEEMKVVRQAYHGNVMVGNHCIIVLKKFQALTTDSRFKIQDSRFKIIFLNKNYIHYTTHRIQVHN